MLLRIKSYTFDFKNPLFIVRVSVFWSFPVSTLTLDRVGLTSGYQVHRKVRCVRTVQKFFVHRFLSFSQCKNNYSSSKRTFFLFDFTLLFLFHINLRVENILKYIKKYGNPLSTNPLITIIRFCISQTNTLEVIISPI